MLYVGVFLQGRSSDPHGYSSNLTSIGSSGLSDRGWLISANEVYSTSYIANTTITQGLIATANIFEFNIPNGTEVLVGIYVNGVKLGSYSTLLLPAPRNASVTDSLSPSLHIFTMSLTGVEVWVPTLTQPVVPGDNLTVTIRSNKPIWMEVDTNPTTQTFTSNWLGHGFPSEVTSLVTPGNAGEAPYTLSVFIQ